MKQQAKIEILQRNVAKWEEAQRIRACLAVVQQKAEGQDGGLKEGSPSSRFFELGPSLRRIPRPYERTAGAVMG